MMNKKQGRAATRPQNSDNTIIAPSTSSRKSRASKSDDPSKASSQKSKAPNVATLLREAEVQNIDPATIDLDDATYVFRINSTEEIDPEALVGEDGIFDGTKGPDPISLRKCPETAKYLPIGGLRRLQAACKNPDIALVKCYVVTGQSEFSAVVLGTRTNLVHGQMLKPQERRACFQRDWVEHQKNGYHILKKNWAATYGVSRPTIDSWLREMDDDDPPSTSESTASENVKFLHSATLSQPPSSAPDKNSTASNGQGCEGQQPVIKASDSSPTATATTKKVQKAKPINNAYELREAYSSLKAGLVMMTNVDADQVRPIVPEILAELDHFRAHLDKIVAEPGVSA